MTIKHHDIIDICEEYKLFVWEYKPHLVVTIDNWQCTFFDPVTVDFINRLITALRRKNAELGK